MVVVHELTSLLKQLHVAELNRNDIFNLLVEKLVSKYASISSGLSMTNLENAHEDLIESIIFSKIDDDALQNYIQMGNHVNGTKNCSDRIVNGIELRNNMTKRNVHRNMATKYINRLTTSFEARVNIIFNDNIPVNENGNLHAANNNIPVIDNNVNGNLHAANKTRPKNNRNANKRKRTDRNDGKDRQIAISNERNMAHNIGRDNRALGRDDLRNNTSSSSSSSTSSQANIEANAPTTTFVANVTPARNPVAPFSGLLSSSTSSSSQSEVISIPPPPTFEILGEKTILGAKVILAEVDHSGDSTPPPPDSDEDDDFENKKSEDYCNQEILIFSNIHDLVHTNIVYNDDGRDFFRTIKAKMNDFIHRFQKYENIRLYQSYPDKYVYVNFKERD